MGRDTTGGDTPPEKDDQKDGDGRGDPDKGAR